MSFPPGVGGPAGLEDAKLWPLNMPGVAQRLGVFNAPARLADFIQPVAILGDVAARGPNALIKEEVFVGSVRAGSVVAGNNGYAVEFHAPTVFTSGFGVFVSIWGAIAKNLIPIPVLEVLSRPEVPQADTIAIVDDVAVGFGAPTQTTMIARFDPVVAPGPVHINTDAFAVNVQSNTNPLAAAPESSMFGGAIAGSPFGLPVSTATVQGQPWYHGTAASMRGEGGAGSWVKWRPFEGLTPFLMLPGLALSIGNIGAVATNLPGFTLEIHWRELTAGT